MCGIIGAVTFGTLPKKEEKRRQESIIYIGSELLQLTQTRGKDATGVSTLFSNGDYMGMKMGIGATEFIVNIEEAGKSYKNFLNIWRNNEKPAKIFLGHCRNSSIGSSYDNANNHPIRVGDIIGIHNGTLQNHDIVFEKLKCKRDGEVDSEAIFRLLHYYSNNGTNPFTTEMIKNVATKLQGTYAVLAFSGNNPYQLAMFRDGRPIEMMFVKPLKTMFIASDKDFLKTAIFRYSKMLHLYNANFVPVVSNQVEFKSLIDDSLAIFDLTLDVKPDTEINDLCDWLKVPFADKTWKTFGNNSYYLKKANITNTTNIMNKSEIVVDSKKSKEIAGNVGGAPKIISATKDKERVGMVWNRALNEYKSQYGLEDSKKLPAVEIDIIAEKVHKVKPVDVKIKTKSETEICPECGSILEKIKNTGSSNGMCALSLKCIKCSYSYYNANKNPNTKTIIAEVEMLVDTVALEKSEVFTKTITKLNNNDELAEELELKDAKSLNVLPLYALANRIKKTVYKPAFYSGYVEAKRDLSDSKNIANKEEIRTEVLKRKLLKGQNNIRTLKSIIFVLSKLTISNTIKDVMKAIKDTFKNKEEIDPNSMRSIFSVGDLRENTMLKTLEQAIKGK